MGKGELKTRLIFAPLMMTLIGVFYYLDVTVMADRGLRGVICAVVLGLLGVAGVAEYIAMFRKAGYAVAGHS